MKLTDFTKKYFLHDSMLLNISFDDEKKEVLMTIDFCYWLQDWFVDGEQENAVIEVLFQNVTGFDFDYHTIDSDTILDAKLLSDNNLEIIIDSEVFGTKKISISAESVSVKEN